MPIRLSSVAKATAVVVLVLAVAYAILQARSALVAIFLGLFVATGIEPLVARMSRAGLRRGVAITLVVLVFVVAVGGVVLMLVVPAVNQLSAASHSLSDTIDDAASAAGDSPLGTYLSRPDVHGGLTGVVEAVGGQLEHSPGRSWGPSAVRSASSPPR